MKIIKSQSFVDSDALLKQLEIEEVHSESVPFPLHVREEYCLSVSKLDNVPILKQSCDLGNLLAKSNRINEIRSVIEPQKHPADPSFVAEPEITEGINQQIAFLLRFLQYRLELILLLHDD